MLQAQRSRLEWVAGPLAAKAFVPSYSGPVVAPLATGILHRETR